MPFIHHIHPLVSASTADRNPVILSHHLAPTPSIVSMIIASSHRRHTSIPPRRSYRLSFGLASIFNRLILNPPFPFAPCAAFPIFGIRLPAPVLNILFCGPVAAAAEDVFAFLAFGPSASLVTVGAWFSFPSSSVSSSEEACFRFLFDIPCEMASMSRWPKDAEMGVGKPLGRTCRIVEPMGRPEVGRPKWMVRGEVNVKLPGELVEGVSRGLNGERWVTFGEVRRDGYSIAGSEDSVNGSVDAWIGILEGEGVRARSGCDVLVFGVKMTRLMVGGRCSEDGKAPGRVGSSFSRSMVVSGMGRCVPAAILAGLSENLGWRRERIDFMLPNLLRYLLLPSDLGALLSVFVDALRLRDGIIELFIDFVLAERAREALVGVVMALGRLVAGTVAFLGVEGALSFSRLLFRDNGRAVEVSSLAAFFMRLPGAMFSKRPVSTTECSDFVDVDFGSLVSGRGSSRPALELLRFNEVAFPCSLLFHVEA